MRGRAAALFVVAAVAFTARAPAEDAGLEVTVSCEQKPAKGRVLCDVGIESPRGRIAWADVLVVQAPPFAPPLRSRVAVSDARSRTDHRVRIPVAFVATAQGRGTVSLRGRAVVCRPAGDVESCGPVAREAKTELVVGTDVVP